MSVDASTRAIIDLANELIKAIKERDAAQHALAEIRDAQCISDVHAALDTYDRRPFS